VSQTPDATLLAFDFGTRRIGVAIGNTLLRVARGLTTIDATKVADPLEEIAALVAQWQPALLVVGLPVHADGAPHAMTANAQRFARQLEIRFALPVKMVDERYTTAAAEDMLSEARQGREGRETRDQLAAQLILQAYFDTPNDAEPAT
jgi:putative holliday junction resolvase